MNGKIDFPPTNRGEWELRRERSWMWQRWSVFEVQGVFFILNKYILQLLCPQSTEEAGLGQNLFLRSWEIFWLPWLWYPSYLTTQYNGLLFGLENGKNTIYSHIKIGKMVHKDKKTGSIRWHANKWNPIGSILTLVLNSPKKLVEVRWSLVGQNCLLL